MFSNEINAARRFDIAEGLCTDKLGRGRKLELDRKYQHTRRDVARDLSWTREQLAYGEVCGRAGSRRAEPVQDYSGAHIETPNEAIEAWLADLERERVWMQEMEERYAESNRQRLYEAWWDYVDERIAEFGEEAF